MTTPAAHPTTKHTMIIVPDHQLAVIQFASLLYGPTDTTIYTTYGLDEHEPVSQPVRAELFDLCWVNNSFDDDQWC